MIAHAERIDQGLASAIADLLDDYVTCIDRDELERWPEFFVEEGSYRILSLENVRLGLSAPLAYYYSQGMLRDRVTALRDALTYEFVYTRHITSPARIRPSTDGSCAVSSNFSIFQTTEEGVSRIFAVGEYQDVIVSTDAGLRFKSRDVILDTFGVPNNIAVPM